jgi:1-pyrroline-5-carboxylate dehydrogenase
MNGIFNIPKPYNETTLQYAPGSKECIHLKAVLKEFKSKEIEIPMYIGSEKLSEGTKKRMAPPHEHKHTLGYYYEGTKTHVEKAITAALATKESWELLPWEQKAAIFLKAADLIAGHYRHKINAATMLCQSKSIYQAEIDASCEFADFLRFNVFYADEIYRMQPIVNSAAIWNRMEFRPLEGFVYALTPFNFTAIAGNLPIAPALMGNVVVWKPSDQQAYSAGLIMQILKEAGLPDGVINMVFAEGVMTGDVVFSHREFAGIHFTGSTAVFKQVWKKIAENLDRYKSYPKIVGETGGKDFILAHASADVKVLVAALIRGAFEFQGQKCSACSRAYIPKSIWEETWKWMEAELKTIKVGSTEDMSCFMNAVIDERAFNKITGYIEKIKQISANKIIFGGTYDKSIGYFVDPTVVLTTDPHSLTMEEEIFGPVLTVYVYEDQDFDKTLELIDTTSPYALTGAVITQDMNIAAKCTQKLRNSAGNFYINDKCTGAVVGQQPFGGARMSGTNDKSGSLLNLLRWVSPRTIKENLVPPVDYRYPFLDKE